MRTSENHVTLENKNPEHYYWLDLFRGLAAMIVVTTHCRTMLFVEYGLLPPAEKTVRNSVFFFLTRISHEAVLLFFVLSGFLVGGKVIQRLKAGTFDLKSYALDRTVRIMLPLLSALILIFICNTIIGQQYSVIDYLGNILSLQGILVPWVSGPLWSLAYEVWFYVLMGGMAWWLTTTKNAYRYVGIALLFVNFLIFSNSLKATYLFIWLLGAMSFFYVKKNNFMLVLGILSLIASMLSLQFFGRESRTFELHNVDNIKTICELCLGISMCLIVQQVIHRKPKGKVAIALNKFGTWLANFSYTLYLTHLPIVYVLVHFGFPKSGSINAVSLGYYLAAIAISLVSAYLIYLVFERRTKYVKEILKRRIPSKERVEGQQYQTRA
ncbi:acyltransferase family protein [Chitinophaga filiformis]|uniref:Acyltransferase n=1 Tax=Chitinophaga filiformis TaxID=104663 RepID=A0ABY4HXM7_CHIFI|nr:acyltransferase [Chitinophaga filiformis]UPK67201.1 acyltransferase [Chitinophaga filiformis]